MKKYLRSSYLPTLLILLLIAVVSIFLPHFLGAQTITPSDVRGYAVADMSELVDQTLNPGNSLGGLGFGWISMSSLDDQSLQEYGVMFDSNTGAFSRQGWSEYGGWLEMDPLGGYPEAPSYSAKIDSIATCLQGTSPCPVTGWIKFTAGGTSQSGGWDGWVKMSGLTTNGNSYGVFLDPVSGAMSGQAWGGGVVGWVDFSNVYVDFLKADTCSNIPGNQDLAWMTQNGYTFSGSGACVQDPCYIDTTGDGYWDTVDPACWPGGAVNITATACNAGSSTINWFSWAPSGSVSCSASGGFGFSGTVGPTGTTTVNNLPDGQHTFTLGPCTDSNGNNVVIYQSGGVTTASTIVQCGTPPPPTPLTVTLSDNDSCKAGVSAVSWAITNGTSNTSCSISSVGGFGFSIPTPPTSSGSDIVTVDQTGITTFTLSCSDPVNGTSSDATQFACGVQLPPETCNGIDDDLDGQVDEGCPGVPTGGVNPIYQET